MLEIVPSGSMLYRAAPVVETEPVPRFCPDTGKMGVYFSLNHPYLAENMCVEYESDLVIAVYQTKESIEAALGKYSKLEGSHVDPEIDNINANTEMPKGKYFETHPKAELFLSEKDLTKITYIGCYFMTYKNAVYRWF